MKGRCFSVLAVLRRTLDLDVDETQRQEKYVAGHVRITEMAAKFPRDSNVVVTPFVV